MFAQGLLDDGGFGAAAALPQQIETALQQGNDASIAGREEFETQCAAPLEVGKGFGVSAEGPARAAALLKQDAPKQRIGARGGQGALGGFARFFKALQLNE